MSFLICSRFMSPLGVDATGEEAVSHLHDDRVTGNLSRDLMSSCEITVTVGDTSLCCTYQGDLMQNFCWDYCTRLRQEIQMYCEKCSFNPIQYRYPWTKTCAWYRKLKSVLMGVFLWTASRCQSVNSAMIRDQTRHFLLAQTESVHNCLSSWKGNVFHQRCLLHSVCQL